MVARVASLGVGRGAGAGVAATASVTAVGAGPTRATLAGADGGRATGAVWSVGTWAGDRRRGTSPTWSGGTPKAVEPGDAPRVPVADPSVPAPHARDARSHGGARTPARTPTPARGSTGTPVPPCGPTVSEPRPRGRPPSAPQSPQGPRDVGTGTCGSKVRPVGRQRCRQGDGRGEDRGQGVKDGPADGTRGRTRSGLETVSS